MTVVCARCNLVIRTGAAETRSAEIAADVSHGICQACRDAYFPRRQAAVENGVRIP